MPEVRWKKALAFPSELEKGQTIPETFAVLYKIKIFSTPSSESLW